MKYNNADLLELFKLHGTDDGLDRINIDDVSDNIIKIILQTLHNSRLALYKELETRVNKKKPKE